MFRVHLFFIILIIGLAIFAILLQRSNRSPYFKSASGEAPTPSPNTSLSPTPSPLVKTNATSAQTASMWGAYVGDGAADLANFETKVGKKINIYADFEGFGNDFPSWLSANVGKQGKTLLIFWESNFGYDSIINGSQDGYIKKFAASAKTYAYPVILVPFDEMNLNEEAWGYGQNGNTASKSIKAWRHIHDLFANVANVKFGWAVNSVSIPDTADNSIQSYYPGDAYVDYVGVDVFNFDNPWQTFAEIAEPAIKILQTYHKPIYIFSMASAPGSQKAAWILDTITVQLPKYPEIVGWVWFNVNKETNWTVWSDSSSLAALQKAISAP